MRAGVTLQDLKMVKSKLYLVDRGNVTTRDIHLVNATITITASSAAYSGIVTASRLELQGDIMVAYCTKSATSSLVMAEFTRNDK